MNTKTAKLELIFTMLMFGTIGTLSRFIDAPSSVICLGRAALGVVMIAVILLITHRAPDTEAVRRNILWLCLSSLFMCINWICQFEAFKHTTIATGTLCYYTQPVFYIIAGVLILKEKLSLRKGLCVIAAFCGMILVSGVITTGFDISELSGALYGVAGGFFYAVVVIINKYMKEISPVETTITQLALVSVIMSFYTVLTGDLGRAHPDTTGLICLIVLGFLYTGIGYMIYFDAVNKLSTQTVGIISYVDPVEAVLLSAFFLKEPVTVYTVAGAVLILGAAAVSELEPGLNNSNEENSK